MKDSNRFKIDPNLVKTISESKGINYGHPIAKVFTDMGDVFDKKKDDELKQIETDTKKLQYVSVVDTMADQKLASEFIGSNMGDLGTYLKDNKKSFRTPEWQLKTQEISDGKMNTIFDESLAAHEMYLKEKGLYLDASGNMDMLNIRKQLAKDSNNIDLSNAFERKYATKLYAPAEQLSIKDSLSNQKTQAEIIKLTEEIKNPERYAPTSEEKIYDRMKKDSKFKKWYEEYSLNKKMGMGVRDMRYINDIVTLALNSDDKGEKSEAALMYSSVYKDAKEVDKFFRNLAPTVYQLNEAQKIVSTGGAGVGDEIKNQFSVWTGLNWDETTQEGRTAFLSVLQPLAKSSMTGTVSDRDMKTLQNSFATLWQSDKAVANALKNKTEQILFNANQYVNKHPNYIKLTGYDNNIVMLQSILDNEDINSEQANNDDVTIIRPRKKEDTPPAPNNTTPQIKFNFE